MVSTLSETLVDVRISARKLTRENFALCLRIQARFINSRRAIEESRDLIVRANDVLRQDSKIWKCG
jgi:hypothetical protein